ncbi:unnamed protein product [Cuscuta campestris]|uniref:CCHC-type domain-containing protein n=1 Tax=Cuscuta campestris TaxID=132261 RepID=A0A484M6J5_9ASTE|nr:unnamed protein product [Cuscuta campestris]
MKKVGDKLLPKTEDKFDAENIKKVENYAKAINMLYCAVNPDDYRKISCCSFAKEMWDKLEVTYEGTDQVREAKIDFLTQEYEMFRMKEHEKIDDMFDHFSKIVNDLHALKKTYTDRDLVRKILRSLTSEWRSKADAIYESIGTSNVTIDGLKSDDDEVKLVMKKFCKLLRKNEKVEDGLVCYGCGEAGHIKNKCPRSGRNARHFKKQRAYISWGGDSGDESSEQEEDEEANLCLIAQEEEESDYGENQKLSHGSGLAIYPAMVDITHAWVSDPGILESFYPAMGDITQRWNALTQRWEPLPIDGNPAMGGHTHGCLGVRYLRASVVEARGTRVLRL